MPCLYVEFIEGTYQDGEFLKLLGPRQSIGRSKSCAIRLRTTAASRQHALLKLDGDVWMLKDLESLNGTFLNGRRVRSAPLAALDQVALGTEAKLRIISLDPAPPSRETIPEATPIRAEPRAMPPSPAAPRRVAPPAPAQAAAPTRHRTVPVGTILFLAGIAFGLLAVFGLWQRLFPSFPSVLALAPIHWALHGAGKVLPDLLTSAGEWPGRALAALYYGLAGLALAHPMRRWLLLFLLCTAHIAAILGTYDVLF